MEIVGETSLRSIPERMAIPRRSCRGSRPLPIDGGGSSVRLADFDGRHGINDRFRDPEIFLYKIENATVLVGEENDGAVVSQSGQLIIEPSVFSGLGRRSVRTYPVELRPIYAQKKLKRGFIAFDAAWTNYYHLLCLMAPKCRLALTILGKEIPICVPLYPEGSTAPARFPRDVYHRVLDLSVGLSRCLFLDPGSYHVGELYLIWTEPAAPTDIIELGETQEVFDHLRKTIPPPSHFSNKLIYISRELSADQRLDNEEAKKLDATLGTIGFEKAMFDNATLDAQAMVAANAAVIAGVHGAGLANLVFARPGTLLIEFQRKLDGELGFRPWFYELASCAGNPYVGFNLHHPAVVDDIAVRLPQLLRQHLETFAQQLS